MLLELIFFIIIAALLPLAKYPVRYGGAFHLKESAFCAIGTLYLCITAVTGMKCVDTITGNLLLVFVLYTTCSVIWTSNIEQSWQDIIKWWAIYGLFIITSSIGTTNAMIISFIPIPFFLAWGFIQSRGKDPLDRELNLEFHDRVNNNWKSKTEPGKAYAFWGSIGNTNHTASFIVPYVFIALYLGTTVSPWFYLAVPALLYGLYLTHCYSALVGLVVGLSCAYPPYSLLGFVVMGMFVISLIALKKIKPDFYNRKFGHKQNNLVARVYYWKVAISIWKKRWIYGSGIRSFRKELYEQQAILNSKDPSLLGRKESAEPSEDDVPAKYTPYPTRAHNDYIEILSDLGSIGFILFVGFLVSVVYSAIVAGNYILLGGVICLAVGGMWFYTLSTFSYVPYAILLATATASSSVSISIPVLIGVALALAGFKMIMQYAVNYQLSLIIVTKAGAIGQETLQKITAISVKKAEILEKISKTDKKDHLRLLALKNELEAIQNAMTELAQQGLKQQNEEVDKALALAPTDGYVVTQAIQVKQQFDPWLALHFAERSIHHFDGVMKMWAMWMQYGALLHATGNWEGAKRALRFAIFLNPSSYEAHTLLRAMEQREKEMQEAKSKEAA